jgi:hypothetical protein
VWSVRRRKIYLFILVFKIQTVFRQLCLLSWCSANWPTGSQPRIDRMVIRSDKYVSETEGFFKRWQRKYKVNFKTAIQIIPNVLYFCKMWSWNPYFESWYEFTASLMNGYWVRWIRFCVPVSFLLRSSKNHTIFTGNNRAHSVHCRYMCVCVCVHTYVTVDTEDC